MKICSVQCGVLAQVLAAGVLALAQALAAGVLAGVLALAGEVADAAHGAAAAESVGVFGGKE